MANIAFWGPLFNAASRVIVGMMVENKTYPMGLKLVSNIFYVLLFFGLISIGFIENNIMFAIGVILVFIFLGASIVIPAIFIPRQLGGKTGSEI